MFVKGVSGNPNGRPSGSINKTSQIKRDLQKMLGNILLDELDYDNIKRILKTASPSSRLRFIEGSLKYLIPAMTMDVELDEIIDELEHVKASQN